MFFVSDSNSGSSDEENKKKLILQKKTLRYRSNVMKLPDNKFQKYFCLNKNAFNYVLEEIAPEMEIGARSNCVSNRIKLAATLLFLGQGSYQLSVGNDFNLGLSQPVVCRILSETLSALEKVICPLWIKLEMREEEKSEAKVNFFEKNRFPGVIGCVDGTHIKILAPNKDDQHMYYNRKGFFSLNAMVICDHKMRIRFLDARHAGASHDSLIWNVSKAKHFFKGRHDAGYRNYWLLGDAGYPLEPYLITPYRSASEGSAEAIFNTKHAKARNIVERTIGVLKNIFRCILGACQLHYKPAKAIQITNVCAALHNICIEYGSSPLNEDFISSENNLGTFESNDLESGINAEASAIREQIKHSFL